MARQIHRGDNSLKKAWISLMCSRPILPLTLSGRGRGQLRWQRPINSGATEVFGFGDAAAGLTSGSDA